MRWLDVITSLAELAEVENYVKPVIDDSEIIEIKGGQQSSPTPQFKGINSSALSLLHSTTLTSVHDHRKNHSLD